MKNTLKIKKSPKNSKKTSALIIWFKRLFWTGVFVFVLGAVSTIGVIIWAIIHYSDQVPDYRSLASYEPAVTTRVHAGDGSLMEEFATQPRLFIPIEAVPEKLKQAFMSSEDRKFYHHNGLDYVGMMRAFARTGWNLLNGRRQLQGASTITQQVARNMLLTLDQKLDRKVKEMILALRIERALSKDRIFEIYLNEINFGNRSYGVAAAALNYFNKSVSELTIAQMAYLAAVPKAPHNYHPVHNKDRAVIRRNWVLSRMAILGYIDQKTYQQAISEDLVMIPRTDKASYKADYYAEEVRRRLKKEFGAKTLYEGGLSVRTSLEPFLQSIAEKSLRDGLVAYDRRHGWRGPIQKIKVDDDWQQKLQSLDIALGYSSWRKAVVHEVNKMGAIIGFADGSFGFISFEDIKWARPWRRGEWLGPKIKDISDVLALGFVIAVEAYPDDAAQNTIMVDDFFAADGQPIGQVKRFTLQQIPEVSGALVALDPHTGRVLALTGGFDFKLSQFNRATQARRQPGSAIKPFVYVTALENGFTPASLILDAPFVIQQGEGQGKWKPRNSSNKVYGPSTLRLGIEKSRNLMTVRLAQFLGMSKIVNKVRMFGIGDGMEPTLAGSLGAGEVTPLQLTAAYGMLVNGGKKITPTFIDKIQDRRGKIIMRRETRDCQSCKIKQQAPFREPDPADTRARVVDEMSAYQMVSMLEGVVERGTGRRIRSVGKPLAGKTGTTNDSADAWFVGFSPDLVVGVFTGFDLPRSLGRYEEGSTVAAPIFKDFMQNALSGQPGIPFRTPSGIRFVRIDATKGTLAEPNTQSIIMEAFKPGSEPVRGDIAVLDGSLSIKAKKAQPVPGNGIY